MQSSKENNQAGIKSMAMNPAAAESRSRKSRNMQGLLKISNTYKLKLPSRLLDHQKLASHTDQQQNSSYLLDYQKKDRQQQQVATSPRPELHLPPVGKNASAATLPVPPHQMSIDTGGSGGSAGGGRGAASGIGSNAEQSPLNNRPSRQQRERAFRDVFTLSKRELAEKKKSFSGRMSVSKNQQPQFHHYLQPSRIKIAKNDKIILRRFQEQEMEELREGESSVPGDFNEQRSQDMGDKLQQQPPLDKMSPPPYYMSDRNTIIVQELQFGPPRRPTRKGRDQEYQIVHRYIEPRIYQITPDLDQSTSPDIDSHQQHSSLQAQAQAQHQAQLYYLSNIVNKKPRGKRGQDMHFGNKRMYRENLSTTENRHKSTQQLRTLKLPDITPERKLQIGQSVLEKQTIESGYQKNLSDTQLDVKLQESDAASPYPYKKVQIKSRNKQSGSQKQKSLISLRSNRDREVQGTSEQARGGQYKTNPQPTEAHQLTLKLPVTSNSTMKNDMLSSNEKNEDNESSQSRQHKNWRKSKTVSVEKNDDRNQQISIQNESEPKSTKQNLGLQKIKEYFTVKIQQQKEIQQIQNQIKSKLKDQIDEQVQYEQVKETALKKNGTQKMQGSIQETLKKEVASPQQKQQLSNKNILLQRETHMFDALENSKKSIETQPNQKSNMEQTPSSKQKQMQPAQSKQGSARYQSLQQKKTHQRYQNPTPNPSSHLSLEQQRPRLKTDKLRQKSTSQLNKQAAISPRINIASSLKRDPQPSSRQSRQLTSMEQPQPQATTSQPPNAAKELNPQQAATPSNKPTSKFKSKVSTERPSVTGTTTGKRMEASVRRKDEQRLATVATADQVTHRYQMPSNYKKFVEKDQIGQNYHPELISKEKLPKNEEKNAKKSEEKLDKIEEKEAKKDMQSTPKDIEPESNPQMPSTDKQQAVSFQQEQYEGKPALTGAPPNIIPKTGQNNNSVLQKTSSALILHPQPDSLLPEHPSLKPSSTHMRNNLNIETQYGKDLVKIDPNNATKQTDFMNRSSDQEGPKQAKQGESKHSFEEPAAVQMPLHKKLEVMLKKQIQQQMAAGGDNAKVQGNDTKIKKKVLRNGELKIIQNDKNPQKNIRSVEVHPLLQNELANDVQLVEIQKINDQITKQMKNMMLRHQYVNNESKNRKSRTSNQVKQKKQLRQEPQIDAGIVQITQEAVPKDETQKNRTSTKMDSKEDILPKVKVDKEQPKQQLEKKNSKIIQDKAEVTQEKPVQIDQNKPGESVNKQIANESLEPKKATVQVSQRDESKVVVVRQGPLEGQNGLEDGKPAQVTIVKIATKNELSGREEEEERAKNDKVEKTDFVPLKSKETLKIPSDDAEAKLDKELLQDGSEVLRVETGGSKGGLRSEVPGQGSQDPIGITHQGENREDSGQEKGDGEGIINIDQKSPKQNNVEKDVSTLHDQKQHEVAREKSATAGEKEAVLRGGEGREEGKEGKKGEAILIKQKDGKGDKKEENTPNDSNLALIRGESGQKIKDVYQDNKKDIEMPQAVFDGNVNKKSHHSDKSNKVEHNIDTTTAEQTEDNHQDLQGKEQTPKIIQQNTPTLKQITMQRESPMFAAPQVHQSDQVIGQHHQKITQYEDEQDQVEFRSRDSSLVLTEYTPQFESSSDRKHLKNVRIEEPNPQPADVQNSHYETPLKKRKELGRLHLRQMNKIRQLSRDKMLSKILEEDHNIHSPNKSQEFEDDLQIAKIKKQLGQNQLLKASATEELSSDPIEKQLQMQTAIINALIYKLMQRKIREIVHNHNKKVQEERQNGGREGGRRREGRENEF